MSAASSLLSRSRLLLRPRRYPGALMGRRGLSSEKPLTVVNNLDPAFDVASKIVRNMTDMQMTKMLHMYCGGNFVNFFGQVSLVTAE